MGFSPLVWWAVLQRMQPWPSGSYIPGWAQGGESEYRGTSGGLGEAG